MAREIQGTKTGASLSGSHGRGDFLMTQEVRGEH